MEVDEKNIKFVGIKLKIKLEAQMGHADIFLETVKLFL